MYSYLAKLRPAEPDLGRIFGRSFSKALALNISDALSPGLILSVLNSITGFETANSANNHRV